MLNHFPERYVLSLYSHPSMRECCFSTFLPVCQVSLVLVSFKLILTLFTAHLIKFIGLFRFRIFSPSHISLLLACSVSCSLFLSTKKSNNFGNPPHTHKQLPQIAVWVLNCVSYVAFCEHYYLTWLVSCPITQNQHCSRALI